MPTKIFPAYLFLGEEDFLKEQAVEKLKSAFLSKETKDLNYSVFYAREKNFNLSQMLDNLNTSPFLSKKRLVVLKDAGSLAAAFKKSILSYLDNPKETSVFIIESAEPSIKGEFLLELSKRAHLVYYRRLTDSDVSAWLVRKAALSGRKIMPDAVKAIKENLPNDMRILCSNMDNIILYTGKRHSITKQDVDKVVGVNPSHTAFDLIASIEKKDANRAMRIFSSLRKDKRRETELLGLLAWNARMLLRVRELLRIKNKIEICKDLGLNPRSFDAIAKHAGGFKKGQILSLLDEILRADLDIKTGGSSTLVMERLIVKMCAVI